MRSMGRRRKHDQHLPWRMYQAHGAYYFHPPKGKKIHLGRDYTTALIAYAKLIDRPITTMGGVFDRYELEVLPKKAATTQVQNRLELARLRRMFAGAPPDDITPRHIYGYMDRRPPIRANREKALLSHIFRHAIKWGVATDNPCRRVMSNPEKPRDRYVTDDEFWSFHAMASPVIKVAMTLALLLGLRQGRLLDLRLQHVTEDGIAVDAGKGGKKLLFEWNDDLRAAVEEAKALRKVGSMFLICNRRGQQYTRDGFKAIWQRTMKRWVESGGERFRFHDLRAKSASDHESGEHLGHQDKRTLERVYRRKPLRVRPVELN